LLSADAIIDLPFGKGQKYLSNGGSMDRFVSGWQINIIQSARTGFLLGPLQLRPGSPVRNRRSVCQPTAGRYMNGCGILDHGRHNNSACEPCGNCDRFGNEKRNAFTGQRLEYDVRSSEYGHQRELKFQLGLEFFNFWNHANELCPLTT